MTEAFKVTRQYDGLCVSFAALPAARLAYVPGIPTKAAVGACLVFSDLLDALRLISHECDRPRRGWHLGICLWRCVVSHPMPLGRWLWPSATAFAPYLEEAWAEPLGVARNEWPPGTLAFKEVTLTEQLLGPGMEV